MNPTQLSEKLTSLEACAEAREWAQGKDLQTAWATCERGDWMLWLAQKSGVELRPLTAAKAACAEFARTYMKDPRSITALDAAHAFGRGECSADDLASAAAAASAAASYASYAAYAAAYAAAAYAVDGAYARSETLRKCSDEVRKHITVEMITP